MRRVAAVIGTAAVLMLAAGVYARAVDFTGKWTPDADKNAAANPAMAGGGGGGRAGGRAGGGGGMAGGGALDIKQDATSLTVTRQGQNGPMPTTYKLDGTSQDVTMGQTTAKVTAKVDGDTIVVETTRDMNGTPSVSKAVYSMEGGELLVTSTQPGRNGGDPTTRKTYYKKSM